MISPQITYLYMKILYLVHFMKMLLNIRTLDMSEEGGVGKEETGLRWSLMCLEFNSEREVRRREMRREEGREGRGEQGRKKTREG